MRSVSENVDGSYNLMEFTELQKKKLEFIIDYIQERTGGNKKVSWHRAVGTASTDCPGKNIIAYLGKYLNGFRVGYDKPGDTREGHYYKKENNKFVEVTDKDLEGKIIKVTRQEIKPVSEELEGVKSKIKQGEREILDLRQVTIGNDKATEWLDKVYIEVLNRYVDPNGWKSHRVLGEKAVREILIQSDERKELVKFAQQYPEQVDALDTLYMEVFKRPSDLAARRQYISDGNLDLEAVRVALLNSREYNTRADGRLDNNPKYNVI
jgi:hypothetical protein